MKAKKLQKQILKDIKAYMRIREIVRDGERHARVEEFIFENKEAIDGGITVNMFIKNAKIKMGGKK